MHEAALIVAVVALAAGVAGFAQRFGLTAPLVLTAVGIVLSFVPFVPDIELEPEITLVAILPPLLYSTAIRIPVIDFKRNRRPILLLSVGLVLFTAFAVAAVVTWLVPEVPFAAALALGAVVAPPDAVAATAVARRVHMPRRAVTLLEGESLLNDATALTTLRTALAAVSGGFSLLQASGRFVAAVLGGLVIGWLIAAVASALRRRIVDPVIDTTFALLLPYVAYLVAEELKSSGVIAVVVAGLLLGHRSPEIQSASARVTERVLWRSIQFVLESVVFLLIGLQLRKLLEGALDSELSLGRIVAVCASVTLVVILARMLWVFPASYLPRLIPRVAAVDPNPPWQMVALMSWAGMRGVVTIAAAFTLPEDIGDGRVREVLVLAAFTVVVATLLVQGATLPWVVRQLRLPGPDPAQDALDQAIVLQKAADAGLARLEEITRDGDPPETVESLRSWTRRQADAGWERLGSGHQGETPAAAFRRLRTEMLQAERGIVVHVRRAGKVASEVLDGLMQRFDQEEAMIAIMSEQAPPPVSQDEIVPSVLHGGCEHLDAAPLAVVPDTPQECGDCVAIDERNWVHLRMCMTCGHVGCCDSSPRKHASGHYRDSDHPVIRSIELGEAWRWCFVDSRAG